MKEETSTRERRKVIAVEIGPELAEAVLKEAQERTTVYRKVTLSDIVREALFARYFGGRQNV
jgi:hypothetical protein